MNIYQACLQAAGTGKEIYRVSQGRQQSVFPTNTKMGCIVSGRTPAEITSWAPKLGDLLAEDWQVEG